MSISLNFVQTEYVLTRHDNLSMKLLFFCAFAVFIVFVSSLVMAIGIYDEERDQYQSYLADIVRVFALIFEIFYIVLSTNLFLFIAPDPAMHKDHRESFHPNTEEEREEAGGDTSGIVDAQDVLTPQTMVYIKDGNPEWKLASVDKFAPSDKLVYVTKCNGGGDVVVIDLNGTGVKDIKLALFGIDPMHLPRGEDLRYNLNGIPIVLMALRDKLFALNGHLQRGILKKKPKKSGVNSYKLAVEQNRMNSFEYDGFDVHICGALIIEFYRVMPVKVLHGLGNINDQIKTVKDMELLLDDRHDEQSKTLTLWLWNLCAEIVQSSSENKMSIEALATVISPILCAESNNVSKFCELGI